jgi:23S rRNA (uracil-5-)-methyltransferase RumA
MGRRRTRGSIHEFVIDDFANLGKGLVRHQTDNGPMVVFVENAIPGQRVSAQVLKARKSHWECRLLDVLEKSDMEIEIPFQQVSGAPYITLPLDKQLAYKKESSLDLYRKLGNFQNPEQYFDELIASPLSHFYRNKMEYSFSCIIHDEESGEGIDGFGLGFKRRGAWWKVENLEKPSGLFDEEFETKLQDIKEYCEKSGLAFWHPPKKVGFFRHLVVRKSFKEDCFLINLVTSSQGKDKFDFNAFSEFMQGLLGKRLAGLQTTTNDDVSDRAKFESGLTTTLYGENKISEEILGLNFEISMESFFQTNPKCAEKLYSKALDYVYEGNEIGEEYVMDLFCGTGTISQLLAGRSPKAKIVGVDIIPQAIENAEKNALRNEIKNVEFYAADVGKFLNEHPQFEGKIKTIVLDPPRAGIVPKALQKMLALGAKRIVYVSCNPATQARDLATMREAGYVLKKISFVDQFPHTSHIEAVALLEKNA